MIIAVLVILMAGIAITFSINKTPTGDNRFITYIVDPKSRHISFYWKNDSDSIIRSIKNLKTYVESKNQELVFAVNGGMYNADRYPQGLFIQDSKLITPLDTISGEGNFYLKPNGVFYITESNIPVICKTEDFTDLKDIKYATQSGPMLVIDGQIHSAFIQGSKNLHIRNGVGILPDGRIVFVMSKVRVNFHEFASYFRSLGCKNALYLDGYVSRTYLPEQNWAQTDGDFGVIIGVTK